MKFVRNIYSCIYPSSRAVLTNKRNFFTGLRFEVEQASRGLSATADLLVSDCVAYRKIKLANNSRDASTVRPNSICLDEIRYVIC